MNRVFSKLESDPVKLEYMQWLDLMAQRFGCTTNDIGAIIRDYEKILNG